MTDDIVARLRSLTPSIDECVTAADEIERLRAETKHIHWHRRMAEQSEEIERLRALITRIEEMDDELVFYARAALAWEKKDD